MSELPLDASKLPGTHRSRVFVGGSYEPQQRPFLDRLSSRILASGFDPVIADAYQLLIPEHDIHDVTLTLLHSCRLAIFDVSRLSGALMEVERIGDYGLHCLLLYGSPTGQKHLSSRMLSSFVNERDPQVKLAYYVRPVAALEHARRWLVAMKRMIYARDA